MRIVSISSSRADVGILRPVWSALAGRGVDLHVVTTGMHRAEKAPMLALDGIEARLHPVGADLGGRADAVAALAMGSIASDCGALYDAIRPDIVLVTGDRLDMLPAATATLPFNIPLAHLHGGEVTEGAIDDRIRHALTKLSHLHLVSCRSAAERVERLGEEPWRIHVTGAPGLDTLVAAPKLERNAFLTEVGLDAVPGAAAAFILATVHPETNAPDPQAPMSAVLAALDELVMPVLFTAPNSDPGGAEMAQRLSGWIAGRPFARFIDTLGSRLYPNALRHAAAMVGNSSSGIVESGLFGLPVVDVGERQKGRERGENVVQAPCDPAEIARQTGRLVRGPRAAPTAIYGDGAAAGRIADALFSAPIGPNLLVRRWI